MDKGQVPLEIILAISVILICLTFIYVTASVRNIQKDELMRVYANDSRCIKIALAISNVYSSGPRSRLLFEIDKNAFIGDKNVTISENGQVAAYCEFPAKVQPVQLGIGKVEAKNVSGKVVLSNV